MKNVVQLAAYIRFQLEQLKAQNKHHEFEHLARHFARLRICESVLPATGPVGAGGDQGRDFESYRSYLASTPIAAAKTWGLVTRGETPNFAAYEKLLVTRYGMLSDDIPHDDLFPGI
jgi:hypothetical protein